MIGSVGDGTFAVLLVSAASIVIALLGGYFVPRAALLIALVAVCLPFIAFGIIASAPKRVSLTPTAVNPFYREEPASTGTVDSFFPIRLILVIVLALGLLVGVVYRLAVLVLQAPPFTAPVVQCKRQRLESLHPSWFK